MILLAASSCLTQPPPPSLSTSISNPLYVIACSVPCFIPVKKMTDPSLIQQLFTHAQTWHMCLKCGYNYRIARNCFKAFTHAKGRVGIRYPTIAGTRAEVRNIKQRIIIFRLNNLCLTSNSVTTINYNFCTRTAVHAVAHRTAHIGRWEFIICELLTSMI